MQLDTRLPLLAAQQPALQFQPETRLESLGKIAPAINAMRQMQAQQQTQQQEMQRMMQRSAALDEMRRAMQDEDLGKYAQALINSGDETLMQKGAQLQMADLQDRQFRRQFGGITGTPTPDQLSQMALSGQRGIEVTGKLAGRYVPVGQNVLDKFTGQIIAAPPKEVPANALVPGAAPAAAGMSADQRARILAQRGYEEVDGKVRPIPGGFADPEIIRRQAEARRVSGAAGAGAGIGAATGAPPAGKPMSESELARRRDAVAKEYRNAGTALQNLQETLNSAQQVRTAPGLERATGFSGAYLPSFPGGAAAQAQTRLENLRGKITAMGKATAAMSGAIGSIANQEWKILADQIAVIDPVKGVGPMLEQIASLEEQARAAMGRIKDAYEKQFGEDFERFPQFRELRMPAQGSGLGAPRTSSSSASAASPAAANRAPAQSNLTAAEQAELEALRRRFGRQQ